jgi:hypothetical protein
LSSDKELSAKGEYCWRKNCFGPADKGLSKGDRLLRRVFGDFFKVAWVASSNGVMTEPLG